MSKKTIAEMQAELLEAGYTVSVSEREGWNNSYYYPYICTPDNVWEWYGYEEKVQVTSINHSDVHRITLEKGIRKAYRHLQDTRKLAALEEFVKEIVAVKTKGVTEGKLCHDMLDFIDSAKELLAKFEEKRDE